MTSQEVSDTILEWTSACKSVTQWLKKFKRPRPGPELAKGLKHAAKEGSLPLVHTRYLLRS